MAFRELKPDEWLQEIIHGLEYRQRFGIEQKWGTIEAIYYNVHESMTNDGPNILLSQGDSMLSTLTVPMPRIKVNPQSPEAVGPAPLLQALDNTLFRSLCVAFEAERAALHAYLFGTGIVKIGYDSEWGYDPSQDIGGQRMPIGMTLSQFNKKGTRRLETDMNVVPGMPWLRAVMPHDIVVPWGTRDVSDAPWIAHRIVRQVDELKADVKYSNVKRIEPQMSMRDFVDSYRSTIRLLNSRSTRQPEYVEIWEIHDRRTAKIHAVVSNHDKFIRSDRNALQINNRLPFASISFTPRSRAFWTTPDAYYLFHIQAELSDVAKQRTKQRRIATVKFAYSETAMDEEEVAKLLSPDVGAAAKVKSGFNVKDAIARIDNQVNQFLTLEEEHLRQNAREQIGFSRNQLGEFSGGRKTATEVATVDNSSRLRMSRRGLGMKRLYEDIVEIINGVVFTHWTLPRYVEVIGEKKTAEWLQTTGAQLKGRYSYEITLVDDATMKAEGMEALQLYMILAQDPSIDPVALREYLINSVADPRFERLFNANIQAAVSAMRAGGGGVLPQNAGGQGAAQVQGVSRGNGQATNASAQGLLASRGLGS